MIIEKDGTILPEALNRVCSPYDGVVTLLPLHHPDYTPGILWLFQLRWYGPT